MFTGFSPDTFGEFIQELFSITPYILPACIAFLGFKKAVQFLLDVLKGAQHFLYINLIRKEQKKMTYDIAKLFTGENAIDLTPVLSGVYNLLPVVIPVAIGFIALRKGISFLFSSIQGA